MRLRPFALAAAVAAAALSATACSLIAVDREIDVILPTPPAHWQLAFPTLCVLVCSRDSGGERTEATSTGWGTPVALGCARAVNVPVVAYPFVPGDASFPAGALRPAGAFFPLSLRRQEGRDVLELSWEDGPAALVLDRVAATGRDLSRFNVTRLRGYLGKERDPWTVDLDTVAQEIAQGTLTAWDIDQLPAWDVTAAAGDGTWFLESPFSAPARAQAGLVSLLGVPQGEHLLVSLSGECWRLQAGKEGPLLRK